MQYLSKSDFKVAMGCPTKLYYRKSGYPSVTDGNEYMQLLAEGGYMFNAYAQLKYPNGILVPSDSSIEEAIIITRDLLQSDEVVLFEATLVSNQKLIRVDILHKKGNELHLIEVKSKSWDSDNPPLLSKMKEYLEDLAYQTIVLEEAYPDAQVIPHLLMPDKAKSTTIDGLNRMFQLRKEEHPSGRITYNVDFSGDKRAVLEDDIIALEDFTDVVNEMKPKLTPHISIFVESIKEKPQKIPVTISCNCKGCEFRDEDKSGYKECWGAMAEATEHVLELSQLGNFNRDGVIDSFIQQGKVTTQDLPLELVAGKYNNRAFYQITKKEEWLDEEFSAVTSSVVYPLHFIDFETSRMALPYHSGMRPYENIAFQWSCHTVKDDVSAPTHTEWINVTDSFPNFAFARSLMQQVGNTGSLLTWSHHERTILKDILSQIEKYNHQDEELRLWLERLVDDEDRIVDLNKLALKHYFHPYMKGRTSIKVTLPSVLLTTSSARIKAWLENFDTDTNLFAVDGEGKIRNPYELLPKLELIEKAEKVSDGTGAMRAYQEMMYGISSNDLKIRDTWKNALLRYCKLDTLAMVIIWEHWLALSNQVSNSAISAS